MWLSLMPLHVIFLPPALPTVSPHVHLWVFYGLPNPRSICWCTFPSQTRVQSHSADVEGTAQTLQQGTRNTCCFSEKEGEGRISKELKQTQLFLLGNHEALEETNIKQETP